MASRKVPSTRYSTQIINRTRAGEKFWAFVQATRSLAILVMPTKETISLAPMASTKITAH